MRNGARLSSGLESLILMALCIATHVRGQDFYMDWRDPGWTNLATGLPSEFLTNGAGQAHGAGDVHRLSDIAGSGIDVTFRISHVPTAWNIENRPALGAYFPSVNGIDGDILRAVNKPPAGEIPYYTMEFSRPVTVSTFGFEGMRRNDGWKVQAYDLAGNLVAPNWTDPGLIAETAAGAPLQHVPINLLRGALPEAASSGRYDASEMAFYLWNRDNVQERAAAVVNFNGVVAKKLIFSMIQVDTTTGTPTGGASGRSIYLAGGFSVDTAPVGVSPPPQCYVVANGGGRLLTYNPDTDTETDLGALGASSIEAIAFDPHSGKLYGAGPAALFEIDTETGAANALGEWSPSIMATPFGSMDAVSFTDVDAMTRDVVNHVWYAAARIDDAVVNGGSDLLFQFNPSTGHYIPGAFPGGHDYVRIEKVATGLHLINDLAFDDFTQQLYGIATGAGIYANETRLVEIDPVSGNVSDLGSIAFEGSPLTDIEGLTITLDRRFLVTTGADSGTANTLFKLENLGSGSLTAVKLADLGFGGLYTDYEGAACGVFLNPSAVGGTVYTDVDSNGSFDGVDVGIGNVELQIEDALTGTVLATQQTTAQGQYVFGGLPHGSYKVVIPDANFEPGSPLDGRTPTSDPEGDDDNAAGFVAAPLPVEGVDQVLDVDGINDYASASIDIVPPNQAPYQVFNEIPLFNKGTANNLIASTTLYFHDEDNTPSQVIYSLTSLPINGILKIGTTTLDLGANNTFTQQQINDNLLTYSHDGTNQPTNSFGFTVSDGEHSVASVLNIAINTDINDSPILKLGDMNINVDSVGNVITSFVLNATDPDDSPSELFYRLRGEPAKGILYRSGVPLTTDDQFTQADVDADRITYTHTSGTQGTDTIPFALEDGLEDGVTPEDFDLIFHIGGSSIVPEVDAFTMTCWVNPDNALDTGVIMAASSGTSIATQLISKAVNKFTFQYENLADVLTSQTWISPGFWYHLAATYDGSVLRFYVNGNLEAEKVTTQTLSEVDRLWIGKGRTFLGDLHFDGQLDSASYWDTALTPFQIESLAQVGAQGHEPGLIGYWDWDTNAGSANARNAATGTDDMTLNNGVSRVQIGSLTALDFGYTAGSKSDNFTAWQSQFATALGTATNPEDNADGDLYPNILEYALCLHPGTGIYGPGGFVVEATAVGVDVVFYRRAGGHSDLTYLVDGRATLPLDETYDPWSILLNIPGQGTPPAGVTITDLGTGIEEVRVTNIDQLDPLTPEQGFARLTVLLDTGGPVPAFAYTTVYGWRQTSLAGDVASTYGNAFTKLEVISGTVDSVSGDDIHLSTAAGKHQLEHVLDTANHSYFIEMVSGPYEGHRFDIVSAAGAAVTTAEDTDVVTGPPFNTLTGVPADLAGALFVIREHTTIVDYFPTTLMTPTATSDDENADELFLYTPAGWATYWVRDDAGGDHWTAHDDLTFADAGGTVIPPGEGMFLRPSENTTLFAIGPVRKHRFVRPLGVGYNLVAPGFPKEQSISERNMGPIDFEGDPSPALADLVCAYDSDIEGYHCYFFLEGEGAVTPRWVHTEDTFLSAADFEQSFFQPDAAHFYYRANNPLETYFMPLSWCVSVGGE